MTTYQVTEPVTETPRPWRQLIDVDPLEDGRYAALFHNDGKYTVNFLDQVIPLPVDLAYPLIRVIDE